MPEETIPPPTAAPDAAVLKAAEEAVARSREAVAASEQSRRELEAKYAALEAKLAAPPAPPAPAPEVDELKRYIARERASAKIQAARQMGAVDLLSDEQLLALMPDVDPREPDGRAKLEQWRAANARMFRAPGPTPESVVEAVKVQAGDLSKKGGQLFNFDRLVASMFGGGK